MPATPGDAALRPPLPADYAAIAAWLPDATACQRWAGPHLAFPFAAEELQGLLRVEGGSDHCLSDASMAVLGFGQHWPTSAENTHLGRIIVSPDARGLGLGRLLCLRLMASALLRPGSRTFTLRVYRDNARAMQLYASLGFAPVEAESGPDVLFMRTP